MRCEGYLCLLIKLKSGGNQSETSRRKQVVSPSVQTVELLAVGCQR